MQSEAGDPSQSQRRQCRVVVREIAPVRLGRIRSQLWIEPISSFQRSLYAASLAKRIDVHSVGLLILLYSCRINASSSYT